MCKRVESRSGPVRTQKSTGKSAMVQCIRLHTNNCRTRAGESKGVFMFSYLLRWGWFGELRARKGQQRARVEAPNPKGSWHALLETLTAVSTSIQVSWLHNTPAPSSTPQVSHIRVPSLKNACQTPSSMLPTTNAPISNYVTIPTRWGSSTYAPWKLGRPPRRPL
jgi:hypothetical protein